MMRSAFLLTRFVYANRLPLRSNTPAISDRQNVHIAQWLLAPLLVDGGAHRAAHRLGQRARVAPPRPRQPLDGRYHDVEHDIVDHFSGRVLFRDADQIDLGIVGQFALLVHRDGDEGAPGESHLAPLDYRARPGILQDRAVLVEPPGRQLLDDAGIAGTEHDQVAVPADQHL